MCVWFFLSVLHSWCFRDSPLHCCVLFFLHRGWFVDCTHKKTQYFHIFANFPFISYVGSFLTRRPWVWLFFLRPLRLLKSCPQFFGVFIYQVPIKSPSFGPFYETTIFKNLFLNISGQKWPKNQRGLRTLSFLSVWNAALTVFFCYSIYWP